jgi:hypothetical protein
VRVGAEVGKREVVCGKKGAPHRQVPRDTEYGRFEL